MKKEITIILLGILLLGVINASLVGYLSNLVTGTVKVEGPAFYLDSLPMLGKGEYLKLNNNSVNESSFQLSTKKFYSDALGVEDFYPMDFEIVINANVSNLPRNETTEEILESCSIQINILQQNGPEICNVIKTGIDKEDEYKEYKFDCEGKFNEEIDFDLSDRFQLMLTEQCPLGSDATINIKYEDSYIQVKAK
jgi:hypothetical protein